MRRRTLRERLASRLIAAFAERGIEAAVLPDAFDPAQGHWRSSHRSDALRWEASIRVNRDGRWVGSRVGSYSTMRDCAQNSVVLVPASRGEWFVELDGASARHPAAANAAASN
jgi:hypothetical protein